MHSAVAINNQIVITEIPEPQPQAHELVIKSLSCGICGSDLHCVHHAQQLADNTQNIVGRSMMDPKAPIAFGHEFCGEVLEPTKSDPRFRAGDKVVALPFVLRPEGVSLIGFSTPQLPGGFSERLLVDSRLTMPVPNGLDENIAAMTEPMAVALHAVNRSEVTNNHVPLVIGCGPIGLAVIAVLKMKGISPIVASDFSAARRDLARQVGADVVVDPAETSPYQSWQHAAATDAQCRFGPTSPLFGGDGLRPSLIFECVGVPGLIQNICAGAPFGARIIVVGLCMERDQMIPAFPILKELDIRFVSFYSPEEFQQTLFHLAEGELDVSGLISDIVPLDGIEQAFDRLSRPNSDVKILVNPQR